MVEENKQPKPRKASVIHAQQAKFDSIARTYHKDPIGFMKKYFYKLTQADNFHWQAEEFLKYGELKGMNMYAYCGCTGAGKSTLICMTIIWLLFTRIAPKIVVITSTAQQSSTTIFDTLAYYIRNSDLADMVECAATSVTIKCNDNNAKVLCFADSPSGEKANSLRGIHAAESETGISAVFMDEANNFGEWIYQKLAGILATGNSLWVLSSNPSTATGGFYRRFSMPSYGFKARKITAYDIKMPQDRIDMIAANYGGKDSDMYKQMILAEFTSLPSSLISYNEVKASHDRYTAMIEEEHQKDNFNAEWRHAAGKVVMGVDLSAKTTGKSKNCICIRNERRILLWKLIDADPTELKDVVIRYMTEYSVSKCFYDGSGTLGHFFHKEVSDNPLIHRFTPNKKISSFSEFDMTRSEVIFRMAHWIKTVGGIPASNKILSVLCAIEAYEKGGASETSNRITITPKSTLVKFGDLNTMDFIDALSYSFAGDTSNIADKIFNKEGSNGNSSGAIYIGNTFMYKPRNVAFSPPAKYNTRRTKKNTFNSWKRGYYG